MQTIASWKKSRAPALLSLFHVADVTLGIKIGDHTKAIPEDAGESTVTRVRNKTEVATIKLTLQCRRAWEAAAATETRSLANMFEVAILEYCRSHNVAIPPVVRESVSAVLGPQAESKT